MKARLLVSLNPNTLARIDRIRSERIASGGDVTGTTRSAVARDLIERGLEVDHDEPAKARDCA